MQATPPSIAPGHRMLIVSNRLPISAGVTDGALALTASGGGLATGMRPLHEGADGLWLGWPGDLSHLADHQQAEYRAELQRRRIVPVELSRENVEKFYSGFSNRVVWPLFHYLIDRVPVDAVGWEAYVDVNTTFADTVAREYRDGDTIWIHDYQLMLAPALLRERLPKARIGFFLHIPFPSSEVFRTLPWRREILTGLLGADLIGFHTFAYMRHFLAALLHIDGVEAEIDRVRIGDREVRLGVFPMGVDAAEFAQLARNPAVIAEAAAIRRDAAGRKIILGVDRLDYTKGIPRRLEAIDQLLTNHPELRDDIRYIQVAVPSREEVDSYRRFKRQVEEGVGRINGARGTLRSTPVHYVNRSVSREQLVALYCAADVMLVTPLRDGMNLVAKEFVAARIDGDGILLLSEFAGASAELDGAVIVNPYDVAGVADALRRALAMPERERAARMKTLRHRVTSSDVHAWADRFVSSLNAARPDGTTSASGAPEPGLIAALSDVRLTGQIRLLLDYDGTMVPFARSPELAAPDPEALALLQELSTTPGIAVEIVSGRPREVLESWLGHLPLALWSEHGYWHRPEPGAPWRAAATAPAGWMTRILPILEQFTESTSGSQIEIKSASVAWHYRGAQREFGARQAHELRMLLGDALSNQPLEVLEGKKVIEVRLRGVSKAVVADHVHHHLPDDTCIVAIGDDRTDEDLFRALSPPSITIAVGRLVSRARFRVDDYRAVRNLLRFLIDPASQPRVDAGAGVTA